MPSTCAALRLAISVLALLGPAGTAAADPDEGRECLSVPVRDATATREDATDVLQQALASGAPCIRVPHDGHPWIVRPLEIRRDDLELVFDPGVELVAKAGEYRGMADALLTLHGVHRVTIRGRGATLRMQRDDYERPPYRPSEWRHAIVVRGSSEVEIADLSIRDAGGDGIYLGGAGVAGRTNEDVWIHDVLVDRSVRQGLSVISARRLLVEHSVFQRSGPRPPAAGIDIEPNHPYEVIEDVVVRRCMMFDNSGLGMHTWLRYLDASSTPVSILWEHNVVRGSPIGVHGTGAAQAGVRGTIRYRNNVVFAQRAGVWLRQHGQGALTVHFEHDLVVYDDPEGAGAIVLESRSAGRFGAAQFDALVVAGAAATAPVSILGPTSEPWPDVRGTIVIAGAADGDGVPPTVPELSLIGLDPTGSAGSPAEGSGP